MKKNVYGIVLFIVSLLLVQSTLVSSSNIYSIDYLILYSRGMGYRWLIVVNRDGSQTVYGEEDYSSSLLLVFTTDYMVENISSKWFNEVVSKYRVSMVVLAILPTLKNVSIDLGFIYSGLKGVVVCDERYGCYTQVYIDMLNLDISETVVYKPVVFNSCLGDDVRVLGEAVYYVKGVVYRKPFYIELNKDPLVRVIGDARVFLNPSYGDELGYHSVLEEVLDKGYERGCRGIVVYDFIGLSYTLYREVEEASSEEVVVEIPPLTIITNIPPDIALAVFLIVASFLLIEYVGMSRLLYRSKHEVRVEGIVPFRVEGESVRGIVSEYLAPDPLRIILRIRGRISNPYELMNMIYSFVEHILATRYGVDSIDRVVRDKYLLYDIAREIGVKPSYLKKELLFLKKMHLRALGLSYTPIRVDWDKVINRLLLFVSKIAS